MEGEGPSRFKIFTIPKLARIMTNGRTGKIKRTIG
jgi:hypothetical protein